MTPSLRIRFPKRPLQPDLEKLKIQSEDPNSDYNNYVDRLVKLIPAEAIGLYTTLVAIVGESIWIGIIGLFAVLLVRIFGTRVPMEDKKLLKNIWKEAEWPMVIISAISYIIWFLAISDSLINNEKAHQFLAGTVVVWIFIISFFYKPEETQSA